MSSALRNVNHVTTGHWIHETGTWMEDHLRHDETFAVIAHCDDGVYVHENGFLNDPEGSSRLAQRVEEHGVIDLAHWGFHEFYSLSLEERLNAEAEMESLHRNGQAHLANGVFAGGHA